VTIIAGTLDTKQTNQAQRQARAIEDAADVGALRENQFVFLAAFDGTRNDRRNVALSGNPLDTNVAQIFSQGEKTEKTYPKGNLKVGYYPGHGTEGSLVASDWYPGQVTQEAINTAKRAYKDFAEQASAWLKDHPNGDVTTAITAFSRGGAAAAVFTHLLYRDGLVDPADPKKVLIPPGKVGVSAGVIFDPVTTGVDANVAFAPNVKNVVVIQAQNEYRYLFKGVDYANQQGVKVLEAIGNHCNIGGGYDNGLGALYLEGATRFLQRSGVPISEVDPSRHHDATKPLIVYDESDRSREENFLTAGQSRGKWDVFATFIEGAENQPKRLLDNVAKPAATDYRSDAEVESFRLYDKQTIVKVRSYLEDAPDIAVQKYPDLAGAMVARALVENEIANLPKPSQDVIVGRFDDNMVGAIAKGEVPTFHIREFSIGSHAERSVQPF
jgi:hypothetical protein